MKAEWFEYYGKKCCVQIEQYQSNDRTCISIIDDEGELMAIATINLENISLKDDEVIIKDYSENEGILCLLQDHEIVGPVIRYVESGFIKAPICKLLIPNT